MPKTSAKAKAPSKTSRTLELQSIAKLIERARAAYERGALTIAMRLLRVAERSAGRLPPTAKSLMRRVERAIIDRRQRLKKKVAKREFTTTKPGGTAARAPASSVKKRAKKSAQTDKKNGFFRSRGGGSVDVPVGWLADEGEPAPADDTNSASTDITRFPHMRLTPDRPFRPGDEFGVEVFADCMKIDGEVSAPIVLTIEEARRIYDVRVQLWVTQHFEIKGDTTAVLSIDVDKTETPRLKFAVRVKGVPVNAEDAAIFAHFSYNGRPCGEVIRAISLVDSEAATLGPPEIGALTFNPNDPVPDVVVTVTDPDLDGTHLQCQVYSPVLHGRTPPPFERWTLHKKSDVLVRGLLAEFVKAGTKEQSLARLARAGLDLYRAGPTVFKDVFWKLVSQGRTPRTILVVSAEPYIPWELMRPEPQDAAAGGTRQALGVELAIGRWICQPRRNRAPRPDVPLSNSVVIAPNYPGPTPRPLKNAADEVTFVRAAVEGERIDPATVTQILTRFGKGGASLVHFICHGREGQSLGIQELILEGGTEFLTSLEVTELEALKKAFARSPLVFLNACEVGRLAPALVGLGGFAPAFIELGASAVIAPLWSVRDSVAARVAKQFYEEVGNGRGSATPKSFARILSDIRAHAYDPEAPEDTYAAYCFYGDPFAAPRWATV
jgi:hypothetical protein